MLLGLMIGLCGLRSKSSCSSMAGSFHGLDRSEIGTSSSVLRLYTQRAGKVKVARSASGNAGAEPAVDKTNIILGRPAPVATGAVAGTNRSTARSTKTVDE